MRLLKRYAAIILLAISALHTLSLPLVAEEMDKYIAIQKEGTGNIPLVLNTLDVRSKNDADTARSLDAVLRAGLEFTDIFTLVPAPLNLKSSVGNNRGGVNFSALNTVEAEIYVGGKVTKKADGVTLTMEVYDISGSKLLFTQAYTGGEQQLRALGHAFCADLIEFFTGKSSVFGSKIVFVSNHRGFKEIYQCDFDGFGVEQLTILHSITLTPAFSPDGHYLAYTDFSSGRSKLTIKNLASKQSFTVANSGIGIDPAWRNNSELATTLSFEGDQEIYLINTQGKVLRRITKNDGIDLSPTFSPDGRYVAYVSERSGQPQIFTQAIESGAIKRVTFSGNYNTQPAWSPTGDKLAFTMRENSGALNIFVVNTDGSGLTRLTENSGNNESPSWSPDGRMIVFTSNRQGQKKLFVMSATGKNQRQLLRLAGEQMQPSWSLFTK